MKKARILVPPGIGDGYWVLVKLRGLCARLGITPEIWVHDVAPRRAHEMWQRSFAGFAGYAAVPRPHARRGDKAAIKRAYRLRGYPVQRNACGFDYFLSFNGTLGAGLSLDQALPGPSNWYEPIVNGVTARNAEDYRARFGEYVVAAFWEHGMYRKWLEHFPENSIIAALRRLADAGLTVVVMGAEWDRGAIADRISAADERFVNLVGDTNFDALTGLLGGSQGVVGFPAGNTLLGPYFRKPTVLMWHDHFPRAFWRNAVPPDAANYRAVPAAGTTPEAFASTFLDLAGVPA